jgi:hypothetical protein
MASKYPVQVVADHGNHLEVKWQVLDTTVEGTGQVLREGTLQYQVDPPWMDNAQLQEEAGEHSTHVRAAIIKTVQAYLAEGRPLPEHEG